MGKTLITEEQIKQLEERTGKTREEIGQELVKFFQDQPTASLEQVQHELHKKQVTRSFAADAIRNLTDIRPLLLSFHNNRPFFYDKHKIWWLWDELDCKYEIIDETDILNEFDRLMNTTSISLRQSAKTEILEGLKRIGRSTQPLPAKQHWVQFKNKAFSINSKKTYNVTPDYFFTNPIPWSLGSTSNTPTLDRLFKEWVGETHSQALYELLAYSCYTSYPIQLIFCLWGSGANGKSQFLSILNKFLGNNNVTSTELDLLATNRFESFKLYRKLVTIMGETNFGRLTKSSMIKKLVGGDKIGFEMKNKNPFDDYNYAKLIIASNSLPDSDDTSVGFYRRWFIIDFPHEFKDTGVEVWRQVPDEEYAALARKVTEILPTLLSRGTFTGQGTFEERKNKYISVSNPISQWVKEHCLTEMNLYENYNKAYTSYLSYLASHKRRRVKMHEFKTALEDEGFYVDRSSKKVGDEFVSGRWIIGLALCDNYDNYDTISTQIPIRVELSEKGVTNVTNVTKTTQEFLISDDDKEKLLSLLQKKQYTHFEALREHFTDEERLIFLLKKLSSEGLIFSPKPDLWSLNK